MNIQCPSCQTRLGVDPTKYTQTAVVVQCPNCRQKLRVRLPEKEQAFQAEPLQAIVIEESETGDCYKKTTRMYRNPFSFKGRIRRTEYALSYMLFLVMISWMKSIFVSLDNSTWYILDIRVEDTVFITCVLIIWFFTLAWFIAAQSAKRCHDIGNSGWFQLIPFYPLVLMFNNGEKHVNRYGAPVK